MMRSAFVPLSAALLAGGLTGQAPGQPAPEIEFTGSLNGAPKSWEELDGKLVLLDFSETW